MLQQERGGGEILQEAAVTAEKRGGGEILNEVAVNQRRYQPSPSDVGAAIEYLRTSGVHRSRFDINDPFHMMLVNNAREQQEAE